MEGLIKQVDQRLQNTLKSVPQVTIDVSKTLWNKIQEKWMEYYPSLISVLRSKCLVLLAQERDFGTLNRSLVEAYTVHEQVTTDEFFEHLLSRLPGKIHVVKYTFRPNVFSTRDQEVSTDARMYVSSQVEDQLQKAKTEWVTTRKSSTLNQHLQLRILTAVKAVWSVEKHTFTDNVLKKCRDLIIAGVAKWVETTLMTDKDIRDTAVENESVRDMRTQLQKTIGNVEHTLETLDSIMRRKEEYKEEDEEVVVDDVVEHALGTLDSIMKKKDVEYREEYKEVVVDDVVDDEEERS